MRNSGGSDVDVAFFGLGNGDIGLSASDGGSLHFGDGDLAGSSRCGDGDDGSGGGSNADVGLSNVDLRRADLRSLRSGDINMGRSDDWCLRGRNFAVGLSDVDFGGVNFGCFGLDDVASALGSFDLRSGDFGGSDFGNFAVVVLFVVADVVDWLHVNAAIVFLETLLDFV